MNGEEKSHYRISPSSSSRIEKCPGSLRLSEGVPNKTSVYADEGTRAHSVCEIALRSGEAPVHDDIEMVRAATVYVQFCRSILYNHLILDYGIEYKKEHGSIPGFGGTVDFFAVYETDEKVVLHICDFKYGAGVFVSEVKNRQLMSYASIWISNHLEIKIDEVIMSIVQPRAKDGGNSIRSWSCGIGEIAEWESILQSAIKRSDLSAGDHCRWCPAKLLCPAIRDIAFQAAQTEFEVVKSTDNDRAIEDQIAWLIELDRMSGAIKSVLEEVRPTLLYLMEKGTVIPEFKVIQGYSNREWRVTENEVEDLFWLHGVEPDKCKKTELISPAQAEKILGLGVIDSYVERRKTGLRVVPATDKGDPVNVDVFSENCFESIW